MNKDFIHDNRRNKAGAVVEFAGDFMAEAMRKANSTINANVN